jgi:putative peptidoglycan lipid II flippase
MSDNQLFKASSIMALGTIASRVTGLIRNLMLAALLGTAILGDTYNVANTMPNILYNLLIGGALTAVFVPQIVRSLRDSDQGSAFISRLFTVTVTFLFALTVIGILISPQLVNVYAPEYAGSKEFDVTVTLMRYCLPQIFFLGLFALLGQIANAKDRFGPMMWAPVVNNLMAISLFYFLLVSRDDISLANISSEDLLWLGIGTTAGYLAQAFILFPIVIKSGVKLSLRFDWANSQIIKSFKLAGWSFAYAMISQLSYLVTINIATSAAVKSAASGITTGVGYTPYANAYLILILPHSIITVSIVTALLPKLSNLVIDKRYKDVSDSMSLTMRLMGIFIIPAAVLFLIFGEEIAKVLYFGIPIDDANYLGITLSAFAEWVTVGLALIFTIHYFIGAGISFILIKKHQVQIPVLSLITFYLKLILIFAAAVLPIWFFRYSTPGGNLIYLLLVLSSSAIFYLLLLKAFKISEITTLIKVIKGRKD